MRAAIFSLKGLILLISKYPEGCLLKLSIILIVSRLIQNTKVERKHSCFREKLSKFGCVFAFKASLRVHAKAFEVFPVSW